MDGRFNLKAGVVSAGLLEMWCIGESGADPGDLLKTGIFRVKVANERRRDHGPGCQD